MSIILISSCLFIRKELVEALDEKDNLARLILKLYDEYAEEIKKHMKYEEKFLFPYVESLLDKQPLPNYDIDTFSKHHVRLTRNCEN